MATILNQGTGRNKSTHETTFHILRRMHETIFHTKEKGMNSFHMAWRRNSKRHGLLFYGIKPFLMSSTWTPINQRAIDPTQDGIRTIQNLIKSPIEFRYVLACLTQTHVGFQSNPIQLDSTRSNLKS